MFHLTSTIAFTNKVCIIDRHIQKAKGVLMQSREEERTSWQYMHVSGTREVFWEVSRYFLFYVISRVGN